MQHSPYVKAVPSLLAEMEQERQAGNDQQPQSDQQDQKHEIVLYRYSLEGGGVVLTTTPLDDDQQHPPVVDAQEPETDQHSTTRRYPLYVLHFLLLLFLFVGLDNIETVFAHFAPMITVTITPVVKTLSTTATLSVGSQGAVLDGRVLPALTVSQSATVKATGQGHQDATRATGALTFYNGSYAPHTIQAGAVYPARNGIQVMLERTVTIPAAVPPQFGAATVPAQAQEAGAAGNLAASEVNRALSNVLTVTNLTPFSGGRNARDFPTVSKADLDPPTAMLKAQVTQSMQAAFQGQVQPGEQLFTFPCSPTTRADHRVGEEAQQVQVTVSATCRAIAYNRQEFTAQATAQLTRKAVTQLSAGYRLAGNVTISVTKATTHQYQVVVSFRASGTWVYQLNEGQIRARIAGKSRLTALRLLADTPGVQSVSIAGASDHTPLPTDATHLHLLLLVEI
ncbi:MAG TPA: baseplate J/gp47 family protein [Ktedonobacteraceae bacterium]|nr:baseplate J/gp47 family protein [Ktedonobacteraceae bacterium]